MNIVCEHIDEGIARVFDKRPHCMLCMGMFEDDKLGTGSGRCPKFSPAMKITKT